MSTTDRQLAALIDRWSDDRSSRPTPQTVRRSGFDTAIVDTHIVDPAWLAARRRAEALEVVR